MWHKILAFSGINSKKPVSILPDLISYSTCYLKNNDKYIKGAHFHSPLDLSYCYLQLIMKCYSATQNQISVRLLMNIWLQYSQY